MITIRHHYLPGERPGDCVGATVVAGDGVFKVQEWVLTPKPNGVAALAAPCVDAR